MQTEIESSSFILKESISTFVYTPFFLLFAHLPNLQAYISSCIRPTASSEVIFVLFIQILEPLASTQAPCDLSISSYDFDNVQVGAISAAPRPLGTQPPQLHLRLQLPLQLQLQLQLQLIGLQHLLK